MQRRSVPRTDPRYNQIRAKNNDSVKKSREKSRRERDETVSSINELEEENQQLTEQIQTLKHEYQQLQDLFKQYTGLAIDQILSQEPLSTVGSMDQSMSEPVPASPLTPTQITANSSVQPTLIIDTHNEQVDVSSLTSASISSPSSSLPLDSTDLDGAIVLINGVQYKIVSMNKSS